MESLREDGLDQAEALIRHHHHLTQEQIQELDDENFCELAALAYFYEDRQVLAIKRGLMMAVQEMFK